MALPATDSFTGSGITLTTYSANWTLCKGDFYLQSNVLIGFSAGQNGAGWNADAFNANQYSQIKYTAEVDVNHTVGATVRCNVATPNDDFYGFDSDTGASYVFKTIDGVITQLGDNGASWAVGDVARLEISGVNPGTLTPKINGTLLNPPGTQQDSDLDSGAAGVTAYGSDDNANLDDWEGGNLAAATGRRILFAEQMRVMME